VVSSRRSLRTGRAAVLHRAAKFAILPTAAAVWDRQGMGSWFVSYNSRELALAHAVTDGIKRKDPSAQVFLAPASLRAGGFWLPKLAEAISDATAFVLLVGAQGLGQWQVLEYYEALDKRVKRPEFPIILVLLDGQPAPGLPFLRQLHWIVSLDPASEETIGRMLDAATGENSRPRELWRYTAPYRGLAAMTESDSDFFFGRANECIEVLKALSDANRRLPILLGNSGVGKSSLAQAGVLAALMRQDWPIEAAGSWPEALHDSRRWCILKVTPGLEPLKALVEPFIRTWQLDATDPRRVQYQQAWIAGLANGDYTLTHLLDATELRYGELGQERPPGFLLYVDQAEELYVRSDIRQRQRFSDLLAQATQDPRLRAFMSLRSDFLGFVQGDKPLYEIHQQINVPPLREAELREVVARPAALLSARFETATLATHIAQRAAEESARDAGALPLLSYLLDDMWTHMVGRGDGILRLPPQAVELGGVLADRADRFLTARPQAETTLRRIFTMKLASIREDSEPTRRRAERSEFTEAEWRLVCDLADHPNRLLVTATPENGPPYAEVAHEAIFRRWQRLKEWIAAERDFLVWKGGLDSDRRRWERTPEQARSDALLMGIALKQARAWLAQRGNDLSDQERAFIESSVAADFERQRAAHAEASERDAALAALRQAQKLETVGQLTGGVAHDFGVLLTVIGASAELLRRTTDTTKREKLLDSIGAAVGRGASITEKLLSVSRRRPTVVGERTDIASMLLGLEELLRRTLPTNVELRMNAVAPHCFANIDPNEFETAILNLVVNARDALPGGGWIALSARSLTLSGETEPRELTGNHIEVSVADNGEGIQPELIGRAFDPYFTTKPDGHPGLGLSQVYGFAKSSGGTAAILSAPGEGTTVHIYLPASAER
jgi:signal transduction histidine kinase